ncbi:NAD-dependent epimerase/dehydratase family protein [Chloroflexus sp.]|uniref:NAD-dependent epimerase/dehydratase family protein n=1 Tax=Chloroflexus sp. TaxID=1904827 RepID=UPI00260EAE8C|nr:NAD-dependent epimerase/dehydratase family protein [uncultured Chloroflexus sp.]
MEQQILVIGALGQIGSDLVPALRRLYGASRVIASDVKPARDDEGPYVMQDCTDGASLAELVRRSRVKVIYHLAAMLSATAEKDPQQAWRLNVDGLYTVLEVARIHQCQIFVPSSIAAFGPETPRDPTPQITIQRPTTIYGISKVIGELLCAYYATRYNVDARGLRFPGLISATAPPGGGTTDYAVEIFHAALETGAYTCYLRPDTRLPLMYMADGIRAILELMAADRSRLRYASAYNIQGFSATPAELAAAIARRIPHAQITYDIQPDRQAIADSWPRALDDSAAREDWGWRPQYDLEATVDEMLNAIRCQHT